MRTSASDLLVVSPLQLEGIALKSGMDSGQVVLAGGRVRRRRHVEKALQRNPASPVVIAGVAGGLMGHLRPGDVVVADEIRSDRGVHRCPSAPLLASALRDSGLSVHVGPIVEADHVVGPAEGARLAQDGAIAVDMESARLLDLIGSRPVTVVRAVVDTPERPLLHPATLAGGIAALASLRAVGTALHRWAAATGDRRILLAGPRSFCAGVERAVEIVERLLDQHEEPVYVRHQIVHNSRVVGELEERGAVFVEELDEIPAEAPTVFSAHGVSPAVRQEAHRRGLDVVDATCPLVSKVHGEVKRFARDGDTVFLIGHAGHEEVEGTMGEAPENVVLVQTPDEVTEIEVEDPDRVSYVMQTTLAMDEAEQVVAALRERFPALRGPATEDICYATTNRQNALRAVSRDAEMVLVAGSANSSNSQRLVEVARREGARAHLVDDAAEIDLDQLANVRTIGLSAGASAPMVLVDEIVDALSGLGAVEVIERLTTTETVNFSLPKEVHHR